MHKHFNGFIYRFDKRLSGGRESWKCPRKDCKGRIHLDGDMHEVNEHNHVVNPAIVEAKIAVTEIRQRASNSRDPPRLLVQQAQATLSNEAVAEMPQYTTLQRSIQRKRKANGDPIANPRAIEDIVIPDVLRQTLRGGHFLLHDSGANDPDRFFIFETERNLDMLADNNNWFADGTFKVAPHLFYQRRTFGCIHAKETRNRLIAIRGLRPDINPASMCDFEVGFHNAARDVFGDNVKIGGCLFHLGQCI